MLIDNYIKNFDFNEVHNIAINASDSEIYPSIKNVNFRKSWIIKTLFALRRLPKSMSNLDGFIKAGFINLEEKQNEEIVLGLLGGNKGLRTISPSEFLIFNEKWHVKGAWNFSLEKIDENKTILTTETRIICTDRTAKFIFRLYWFMISSFSGLTRRVMLKLIKEEVELKYEKTRKLN